jgi:ubiquinone/menaquinone biosynthesis C-methylase UbiE
MITVDFKTFRVAPGDRLLDAGCGEGRHVFAAFPSGCKTFAVDSDIASLRKAQFVLRTLQGQRRGSREDALLLQGDTLSLPFREGTFHKIICAEVLEHIPDDRAAVQELYRVLRPSGELAVTVPTPFTEKVYGRLSRRYFRTPGGHIRIYHPRKLSRIITAAGFWIYAVGYAHAFHSLYWVLRCLCGLENEDALLPGLYRRFLHRIALDPRLGKWERSCNYLFPKSMVIYAQKPAKSLKTASREGIRYTYAGLWRALSKVYGSIDYL